MNDTLTKLMGMIDRYWDLAYAEGAEGRTHDTKAGDAAATRQALQDELTRLFTPLTDEQIANIAINQTRPEPYECYPVLLTGPGVDYKRFRSAGESSWVTLEDLILYTRYIEQAHGITGEKKS